MIYSDKSCLTVAYGPMKSGKSGELVKMCLDAQYYQHKKVIVFKPSIDDRFSEDKAVSRIGISIPAHNLPTDLAEIKKELIEKGSIGNNSILEKDIVAFDECQFFSEEIVDIIFYLLQVGKSVIVAGLNLDYTGRPIGSMGQLVLMADVTIPKHAYCAKCGHPAHYTQMMDESGKPITTLQGTNCIVGESQYEPRCRECFARE